MVINTAVFHPNGFFLSAPTQEDFWVLLSDVVGWGRFTMIRPDDEFSATGGLFQLVEVLPIGSQPPLSVVEGANVLWRLPEAREVSQSADELNDYVKISHAVSLKDYLHNASGYAPLVALSSNHSSAQEQGSSVFCAMEEKAAPPEESPDYFE